MSTRHLSETEYLETLAHPMTDIRQGDGPFVDVEPYLRDVPHADLQGHVIASEIPDHVYLTPDKRFEHYLMPTTTANVYFVVVADNVWQGFHGHRLIDLNKLYGLK